MSVHDRYHEFRAFRDEGLGRFHSRIGDFIGGPVTRVAFPTMGGDAARRTKRIGPLAFSENSPLMQVVAAEVDARAHTQIFEIGPGDGALCAYLNARFASRITRYDGLELDPHVRGPYNRVSSISELPSRPNLVIAAEVFEHIELNDLYELTGNVSQAMADDGALVTSTPNPLSPGGIARDITHVTNLPWYDLYALLRMFFQEVEITRTYYVWSLSRLLGLPVRAAAARWFELDWCDGIVTIARKPKRFDGHPA